MSKQNIELHYLQLEVLHKLGSLPSAKFSDLLIDGLESEHMNYHLQKLKDLGFVKKTDEVYVLSDKGKDYVNSIDGETKAIEKQPNTSILINCVREVGEKVEFLCSRRLKQPYYGKIGRIGGKVRFGETLEAAARRELFEETGLRSNVMVLEAIYHKLRHREDGEFVQDHIFYIFFAKDCEGELITNVPFQENFWITKDELFGNLDKYDPYDSLELEERLEPKQLNFSESVDLAEGY